MHRGFHRVALISIASVAVGLASATSARAQIVGSAHDFSGEGWSNNQICLPCHTPHNAIGVEINGYDAGRLWNHALPDQGQVYRTNAGDLSRDEALDAYSILCMGCHDGTVALDSFGGRNGSVYINGHKVTPSLRNSAWVGTDLTDDHPVGASAIWPDSEPSYLNPRSSWENQTFGDSRMGRLRLMSVNGEEKSVVSCATCHEPHRRGGHDALLRIDNTSSQMCLACHNK